MNKLSTKATRQADTQKITMNIDSSVVEQLDELARNQKRSRSFVANELIKEGLKNA